MEQHALAETKISDEWRRPALDRIIDRYGLSLILMIFVILGILYDLTVPFFEKPDELKHFAMIQYIQSRKQLPVVRAGVYRPWDQEGTQPPLYHILAAATVAWLDLSDFEEPTRNPHYVDERSFVWRERGNNNLYLHAPGETWSTRPVFLAARLARWLSLLAGAATVGLTYLLARITFADSPLARWLPLLAAALVAFVPQFLHVNSAITNDSLTVTLAAAALVGLALIIRNGGSTRYTLYLGIVLGLGAITKLSLLYLVPLTGLVLLLDLGRHRSLRRLVVHSAIMAGLILLLAGWWYWRNWQLYGDITALNAHLLYRGGPLEPRPTLAQIWQTEMVGLELSFWAAFGAGQILLEPWIYTGLGWVKYVVLLGMVIGLWRIVRDWRLEIRDTKPVLSTIEGSERRGWRFREKLSHYVSDFTFYVSRFTFYILNIPYLLILAMLALWSLTIFIALLRWMQITPASWGRLLYPTLPALGVLAAWGLSQLRISNYQLAIGKYRVPLLGLGLIVALLALAVIGPFRYINSAYGKTPLVSEVEVPLAEIERLDLVYDEAMRLIGYRVEQAAVHPGEWLPVTLYWQAVRPLEKNYTAFVHLLSPAGDSLGQANTYPDGGNWPTSMLEPDRVLADTYYVPVSPDAGAPLVVRLAMGVFEFEDPQRAAKPAINASGQVVEPIVGAVPVLPRQWPTPDPSQPLEVNFGGEIRLIGYDWPGDQKIKPGARVPLTLYWEPLEPPGQNLNLFIHLVDSETETQIAGFDGPPDFPTGFWQPGQTIIDRRRLTLPANLPSGDYELRLGWYNLENFARLPLVGAEEDALSLVTVSVE